MMGAGTSRIFRQPVWELLATQTSSILIYMQVHRSAFPGGRDFWHRNSGAK
jgi:hypothetical protein